MYCSISCSRATRSPSLVVGAQQLLVGRARGHYAPAFCGKVAIVFVKSTQASPSVDVDAVAVDDRLEHDAEAVAVSAVALELARSGLGVERADPPVEQRRRRPAVTTVTSPSVSRRGSSPSSASWRSSRLSSVRSSRAREPADDQMGDVEEAPLARQREDDLVGHLRPRRPAAPRARSRSRRRPPPCRVSHRVRASFRPSRRAIERRARVPCRARPRGRRSSGSAW